MSASRIQGLWPASDSPTKSATFRSRAGSSGATITALRSFWRRISPGAARTPAPHGYSYSPPAQLFESVTFHSFAMQQDPRRSHPRRSRRVRQSIRTPRGDTSECLPLHARSLGSPHLREAARMRSSDLAATRAPPRLERVQISGRDRISIGASSTDAHCTDRPRRRRIPSLASALETLGSFYCDRDCRPPTLWCDTSAHVCQHATREYGQERLLRPRTVLEDTT